MYEEMGIYEEPKKKAQGHKLTSAGSAIATLCFFMPWLLVSCGGQSVKMSGWQLAAGTTLGNGYLTQKTEGEPVFFLALICAILILLIALMASKRATLSKGLDGIGVILLCIVPLVVLYNQFSGLQDQVEAQMLNIELQFGFYGNIIGYIIALIGGVINLTSHQHQT